MSDDFEAHRAKLVALGVFTQADLDSFRATAVRPASGEPPPPTSAMQVAEGFVRTFSESGKYTRYRLILDGRILDVESSALFHAIVDGGTYRVYFTEAGERLYALEPIALSEVPDAVAEAVEAAGLDRFDPSARTDARVASMVLDGLLAALGRAHDFTPADLSLNRRGELSQREQKSLRGNASCGFGCAAFVGAIGTLVAASVLHESRVAVGVIGAATAALVLILVRYAVRARRDAAAGRVVAGVGRLVLDGSGGERPLVLEDGTSFRVPLRGFSAHGHHPTRLASLAYRVYYVPNEVEIMSLEPVDVAPLLAVPGL